MTAVFFAQNTCVLVPIFTTRGGQTLTGALGQEFLWGEGALSNQRNFSRIIIITLKSLSPVMTAWTVESYRQK